MKAIPLTSGAEAIVDDEDYHYLMQWKWRLSKGRATRTARDPKTGKRHTVFMHRVVARRKGLPSGRMVDHRDRNRLNNKRRNLRAATNTENQCNKGPQSNNTSGFKGVSWHKKARKWSAQIRLHGKQKHLGLFELAKDAAQAYDTAARQLHGEFACLNF